MTTKHTHFILFTRYPIPGNTKTRLIPALGKEESAEIQQRMTENAVLKLRHFVSQNVQCSFSVCYDTGTEEDMQKWLGNDLDYRKQVDSGSLGDKMAAALSQSFADGYKYSFVMGADCPEVQQEHLNDAANNVSKDKVVIGPVTDGGYWLLGMGRNCFRKLSTALFTDPEFPWSTDRVYALTKQRIEEHGCWVELLPKLSDVDEPEDVKVWKQVAEASHCFSSQSPLISVIIPALNEADNIQAAIRSAKRGLKVEVLVVDGGSSDSTVAVAEEAGATVLTSSPGRARQMNYGAAESKGEIFLFLHADTVLPLGFDTQIRSALLDSGQALGAFRLFVKNPGKRLRFIVYTANLRSRLLHLPYGDQGIFISRHLFDNKVGYPDVPIMEDFIFIKQLVLEGHKPMLLPAPVTTSNRRWQKLGPLSTCFINYLMVAGYFLGVPLSRLSQWYRQPR